jgi:ribosome-binding factor A
MAKQTRRGRASGNRGYERTDRLGELLREIIAETLEQIDDDRLQLVTITAVDVDRELEKARVFYTHLQGDEADAEVAEALLDNRGRVRRAIGDEARVRRVPEVDFRPDETQRAALRIEKIIHDLNDGTEPEPDA